MRTHFMQVALLVVVAMGALAGSAQASIIADFPDLWYTTSNTYGETRPNANFATDPAAGWVEWEYKVTSHTLAAGETIWFALDNHWDPDKYKTVTMNLTTSGSTGAFFDTTFCELDHGWGYDQADNEGVSVPEGHERKWAPQLSGTTLGISGWEIWPQCSWEWVSVTNNRASAPVLFTNADGNSWCTPVPEPSLGLLLLVGMIPVAIGFRRRRRA